MRKRFRPRCLMAGNDTLGLCVDNYGAADLAGNDYMNGWVKLVDSTSLSPGSTLKKEW